MPPAPAYIKQLWKDGKGLIQPRSAPSAPPNPIGLLFVKDGKTLRPLVERVTKPTSLIITGKGNFLNHLLELEYQSLSYIGKNFWPRTVSAPNTSSPVRVSGSELVYAERKASFGELRKIATPKILKETVPKKKEPKTKRVARVISVKATKLNERKWAIPFN